MTQHASVVRSTPYDRQLTPRPGSACSPRSALRACVLASLLAVPTWPQAAWDFEDEAQLQQWTQNAPQATFALTREQGEFHQGAAAAKLTFNASYGSYFSLQAADLTVAKAASLHFALRASSATPLRIVLAEQDGSEYDGFIHLPPDAWVEVKCALNEFQRAEGTEDENDRLDIDQLSAMTFADLSNLGGTANTSYGRKTGTQHLWLDAIRFDAGKVPGRYRHGRGRTVIDALAGTAIPWLGLGGAVLTPRDDLPDARDNTALQIGYHLGGYQWQGIVTGIAAQPRDDLSEISLRLGGTSAGLRVFLEEYDGSKYDRLIDLARDKPWHDLRLPLDSFQLAKYSTDENERLDPGQIRVLVITVDTRDALIDPQGRGSFYLDDIELRHGG